MKTQNPHRPLFKNYIPAISLGLLSMWKHINQQKKHTIRRKCIRSSCGHSHSPRPGPASPAPALFAYRRSRPRSTVPIPTKQTHILRILYIERERVRDGSRTRRLCEIDREREIPWGRARSLRAGSYTAFSLGDSWQYLQKDVKFEEENRRIGEGKKGGEELGLGFFFRIPFWSLLRALAWVSSSCCASLMAAEAAIFSSSLLSFSASNYRARYHQKQENEKHLSSSRLVFN